MALPVLGTVAVLQVSGTAARATDFWMGDPVEPVSLASFVLLDVLVAIFVWSAAVLLLSSVLHNRLAVLLAASLLLALQFWAMTTVPAYLLPAISVVSNTGVWASDITRQFADFDRLLQRGAVLVLGVRPRRRLVGALSTATAAGRRFSTTGSPFERPRQELGCEGTSRPRGASIAARSPWRSLAGRNTVSFSRNSPTVGGAWTTTCRSGTFPRGGRAVSNA